MKCPHCNEMIFEWIDTKPQPTKLPTGCELTNKDIEEKIYKLEEVIRWMLPFVRQYSRRRIPDVE